MLIIYIFFAAISQAFLTTCDIRKERYPVFSCDHCPMYWYNKLCQEIEGKAFILYSKNSV